MGGLHQILRRVHVPPKGKEPQTLLKNSLFCVRVWSNKGVVVVSGEELRDSATCLHASPLPQTPLLSRLPIAESPVTYSRFLVIHLNIAERS